MSQYRVGAFAAPEREVARLADQARIVAARERAALLEVGIPTAGRGIEIGCGPGFFAEGLKEAYPGLQLAGLDIDAYVLGQARARIPVVRADAAASELPFADGSFDFAYSRLFLRHLADPGHALARMARLVRAGGCVAGIDTSDATLLLDPLPQGWDAIANARRTWFERRGAMADMGHRLPGLFHAAGLAQVRVDNLLLDSAHIGPEAFAAIVLEPFLRAAEPVLDDPPRLAAATAAVERWARDAASFGTLTLFVVGAERP